MARLSVFLLAALPALILGNVVAFRIISPILLIIISCGAVFVLYLFLLGLSPKKLPQRRW